MSVLQGIQAAFAIGCVIMLPSIEALNSNLARRSYDSKEREEYAEHARVSRMAQNIIASLVMSTCLHVYGGLSINATTAFFAVSAILLGFAPFFGSSRLDKMIFTASKIITAVATTLTIPNLAIKITVGSLFALSNIIALA